MKDSSGVILKSKTRVQIKMKLRGNQFLTFKIN